MKKLLSGVFLIFIGLGFLYLVQPFFGFNISASELFGQALPFLKSKTPLHPELQNHYILKTYIQHLDKPRFMLVTESGDLLVTEPAKGNLLLIPYKKPNQKRILLNGLKNPHSIDIFEHYLYVAEENAIGRIEYNALEGRTLGHYERIITNLPDDGGHWTRTIKFGPDGYGYVSIGSSCNACIEKNPLRASICRFKPGENHLKVYANGLRNSVGFDWSPTDGGLYATENGRDYLGDHFPPDELNLIQENQFYGWPYANGDRVPDPKFGKGQEKKISTSQKPVFNFAAHQAALGITFIKDPGSPLYKKALVAFHGSWNSSAKVGYKVVSLTFKDGIISQNDFITGFIKNGKVLGRPVHLVEGKEGEIYLSDDYNGTIYLIEQQKEDQNSL